MGCQCNPGSNAHRQRGGQDAGCQQLVAEATRLLGVGEMDADGVAFDVIVVATQRECEHQARISAAEEMPFHVLLIGKADANTHGVGLAEQAANLRL